MSVPNIRRPQIEDSSHHAGARTPNRGNTIAIQADRDKDDEEENKPAREFDYESQFMFSDAVLVVQNRRLHCHRVILSLYSPVFRAMFRNRCLENQTNEVNIQGDSYEDVRELLDHMYATEGRDMTAESAERLLPIVHRYQMDSLLEMVERTLLFRLTDINALNYLELADRYSLNRLRNAAFESCARLDADRLAGMLDEIDLSQDLRTEILQKRVRLLEKYLIDIQNSFTHSCVRSESHVERVPSNHCSQHSRPLTHIRLTTGPEGLPNMTLTNSTGVGSPDVGGEQNVNAPCFYSQRDVAASILPGPDALRSVITRPISEGTMGSQPNLAIPTAATTRTPSTSQQPVEQTAICEQCAEQLRNHIIDLCKRGLHKIPIVMMKNK